MVYKKLSPNLVVEDVNKAVDFYRDILKFELHMSVPETGDLKWAAMKRDHVEIMLQARDSASRAIPLMENKEAGGSVTLYIEMENVVELYDAIKEKVVLIEDLHTKPYGMREFSIQDNNGFILTFAEEVEETLQESKE